MKQFKLLIIILFLGYTSFSQKTIRGKVIDEQGNSLPGVSVLAKGTTTGTMTLADGTFSIKIPSGVSVLVFSYIGLQTSEQVIVNNIVNVKLYSGKHKSSVRKKSSSKKKYNNGDLPSRKYKIGNDLEDFIEEPREFIADDMHAQGFSYSYGYHQSSILNPTFGTYKQNEQLSTKYGHCLTFSYVTYPLIIDFKWFSSRFNPSKIPSWPFDLESSKIKHRGVELSVSTAVLPLFNPDVAKYVIPYIGAGYQSSNLAITEDKGEGENKKTNITVSSTKMSSPIWKMGILFNLGKSLIVTTEYSQTFKLNHERAFSQFMLSVGYKPFGGM